MELLGSFTIVNEYSCATYYVQILKYRYLAKKESFQANIMLRHHLSTSCSHSRSCSYWGGVMNPPFSSSSLPKYVRTYLPYFGTSRYGTVFRSFFLRQKKTTTSWQHTT